MVVGGERFVVLTRENTNSSLSRYFHAESGGGVVGVEISCPLTTCRTTCRHCLQDKANAVNTLVLEPVTAKDGSSTVVASTTLNENKVNNDKNKLPATNTVSEKASKATTFISELITAIKEECPATFEPIIQLEEVEVKSCEESEETVCSYRSRLF